MSDDRTDAPSPTLSPRERLLALRRRERSAGASDPTPVVARGGDAAPASRAQRALWVAEQLAGPGSAYNTVLAVRLRGALDRDALRDAWRALVRRQAALRTCLPAVGDVPEQRLVPVGALELRHLALPQADADDRALRDALAAHAAEPFDLERGPLARAALLELSPAHHVLSIVVHHVVVDGWSRNLMARELGALYEAFAADPRRDDPLPPLAVSYADYAHWQCEREAGPAIARSVDWWRDRLADLEPVTVPGDRSPAEAPMRPAAVVRFEVPAPTVRALRALAAEENATLFMVLLAAFDVLLMRWSGRSDVAVGTPVAGRPRPELEPLVGYFVNMLVMRTDLSGNPRFRELVARARATTLEALEHQEAPFDRVLAAARPHRDAGHAPASSLFGASFALQNVPPGTLSLPGLACEPVPVDASAAKFDLSVAMHDAGAVLRGELEYATDRYDAATAARLVAQYGRLLDAVAADPDAPLGALATVDDAERTRLLVEFNDTAAPFPDDRCLHEVIAAQARATPEATAVVFGERRLDYAALDAAADRMARRMRALGARPGAFVAIATTRSERMVVAMLAAMKAGAAYLPLDPAQPPERLATVVDDASASVLVATPALAQRLAPHLRARPAVVDPDRDDDRHDRARPAHDGGPDADDATPAAGPRDLVYVIYTSGSTGRPKGVPIEHRSLMNNIAWQVREFGFGPADRFLQRTSVTFDASMWELWTPLCVGASMVIADEHELRDPAACAALIERHGVTFTQFVPSFLSLMLAELEREPRTLPLRLACVGGEALSAQDARRWAAVARAELVNAYGPTECTIDATFERCPREDVPDAIPIGRPIANARTLVLDPSGALTPLGGVGELHVGGVGLARGYLNRPELTAERFVPDAFRPGERLYRTGDLARQRPDGRLLFLGRIDHQVKLRGVRIELGEIEVALSSCPGVSRCLVLLRPDASGSPRIVAWAEASGTDEDALRARLARTLPDYMVPAAIVVLERLPELSSGKLDRNALPEPARPVARGDDPVVAPRTPTEAAVARIWAEVLGLDRLGADDDFFRRGGDSLLAARATARLRALLGIDLGLRATFESPTVAGLAAAIDAASLAPAPQAEFAPIPRVPEGTPVPLLPGQLSLAFVERLEAAGGAYNIPVAVRLRGALDVPALEHALDALVARHPALRTRIDASGELPAQRVEPHARLALERVEVAASALHRALRSEADRPFDLGVAPLMRAVLLELGDDDRVLLLNVHHIVSDGESLRVIASDLDALYRARRAGREAVLPPMSVSLADWAAWRDASGADRADGDSAAARHLAWWRDRLGDLEPLRLPVDRAADADAGFAGDQVVVTLPGEVAAAVRALARRTSATPYMTLLAAFQVLLARWCGTTDVAVGTPLAGRDRVELEPAVGCFVRMLVLRTDLSGAPSFEQAIGRVRESAIESFARQDAPFDRLVAELRPQRERGSNPLFQVTFAFEDDRPAVPMLDGLEGEPLSVYTPTAKFHLSLSVLECEGGLHCTFEYRSALFERGTIEALAARFATLLHAALETPSAPIGRLPLESPGELARLLELGRGADGPQPRGEGIAARVAAVARRTPDAVAIVDGARRITYAELLARADRLARRLVAVGTAPGEIVGLCVERSAAHVVALLAILRTGAAYLPLDAALPIDRAALMLDECAARRIVVDAHAAALAWPAAVRTVRIDADADHGDAPDTLAFADTLTDGHDASRADPTQDTSDEPAFPDPGADALAYVIFTSGSTGRPKGVRVPQAGVLRLVLGTDYVALGPGRVVAQASTCAFDAATFEIWGALLNGATLAIVPRATLLDADALAARLRDDRIDTMFLTTALFNELVARRPALFASLDTVLFGGEAADGRAVRRVLESGPPRRLLNVYGPTETTTFATWFDATAAWGADPSRVPARVPIGRPIAQTTCRVLDPFGAPVPRGTVGELHVGGPGVALGYLNRPELDAVAFVDDPFEPGARLYRTGDRVRWTADGAIEFVGRVDDQVKIRGFRIEPGEIAAALRACEGVHDATVVVHESAPGERRLVAYVVPTPGADGGAPAPLTAQRLRAALRATLPEYMLPSAILPIAALPLNANGKVDRRALPDPAHALAAEAGVRRVTARARPADETEGRLAALWCEVLGRGEVGPEDNFFELGGHSLLALRLLALVERRFARTLPLAVLFEAPTLRALAAALRDEAAAAPARSCVVPVQPRGSRPPLFFVSGWGGALMKLAALARELGPDQPLYVLDTAAFDADEIRRSTLPDIAARMVADLRAACPSGPYRLCGFSLGGKFVHEIARQLLAAGEAVPLLALMDADAPGYPRRRAAPARFALHLRELARLGPVGGWHHLRERVVWFSARLRGERERLFDADTGVADSAVARAMQASADAMLDLWRAFEPGRHAGRMLLIRAARRPLRPSVVDDDPALGWGPLVDGGLDLRALDCDHRQMLEAEHAPALARILDEFLAPPTPAVEPLRRSKLPLEA